MPCHELAAVLVCIAAPACAPTPDVPLATPPPAGASRSPSWNRLSSASVPESIRELAKKYTPGDGPSPATTPAQAAAVSPSHQGSGAGTPVQAGGQERSPTLDPTPHHLLGSMMKRNELYESPPAGQGQALAGMPAVGSGAPVPASSAAPLAAQPTFGQPTAAGSQLSPASAVAQLLGPVLRLTLEEIEGEKAAAGAEKPGGRNAYGLAPTAPSFARALHCTTDVLVLPNVQRLHACLNFSDPCVHSPSPAPMSLQQVRRSRPRAPTHALVTRLPAPPTFTASPRRSLPAAAVDPAPTPAAYPGTLRVCRCLRQQL